MTFSEPLYCIDMGTTNCRVFLTEGSHIWARVEAELGVRDIARGKPPAYLRQGLEALIVEVTQKARLSGLSIMPKYAVGAGMMTSPQGLWEIPHLSAPVDEMDLARHMQRVSPNLLEVTELFLVPGVRTGMLSADLEATLRSDMMRGEETLVVGLLATRRMQANGLLLNLGSHWKWIWVDNQKRIARSRTTLTGELIHATQSHTLLASGLPQIKPSELNEEWLERGGQEARQHGLSRALFSLRLLEQAGHGTPEERLSFLYGSFLEMELLAFSQDKLLDAESICLVGSHALTAVFKRKLERLSRNVQIISEEDRDDSYLEGLRRLFSLARQHGLEAPVTSLS